VRSLRSFLSSLISLRALRTGLGLLITLGCIIWLGPFERSTEPLFRIHQQPEEYMSKVAVWSFTEEGSLENFLSADYWAYLPEIKASKLVLPHLTIYKPDNTLWNIDAKHARVKQPSLGTIEQIELLETVVLERPAAQMAAPIKVETQVIRYQPKKKYAETDQFITMTKPDLKITGVGMRAFLENGSVELLSDVKTSYLSHAQ
jgi:LPS export ABC transporter protein LptC